MNATSGVRTRYLELDRLTANRSLVRRLPAELAFQYHALPIAEWEGRLTVAMAHPEDGAARSAVCQALGSTPYLVKSDAGAIDRLLAEIWPAQPPRTPRFLVLDPPSERPETDDALWAYANALGERLGAALERKRSGPTSGFTAEERRADLVVMGRVERAGLRQVVSGSRARQVAGQLPASLLVVSRPVWPPHRLLLVVRCNETGGAALDWIVSIAQSGGMRVTLLVITPFLPAFYYDDCLRSLTSSDSEIGGWLRRASEQLECWQISSTVKVRRGEPEWQLKQELAGGEYDLVVITSDGTSGQKRWDTLTGLLLGYANCPVLVVRQGIDTFPEVRMKTQLVQDWMARDLVTITTDTTLPEAKRLMKTHHIRHLPVMRDGKLAGIVTWGDIREASASDSTTLSIYELNALLDALCVSYFMTRQPITIGPDASIAHAAQIMLENKIGCLPVVSEGRLVGLITESDIFRVVILGEAA